MSFFYAASKTAVKKAAPKPGGRGHIPISSLQALGCSACPRNADQDKLASPKMKPSGAKRPTVYFLGTSPSARDDEDNIHWADKEGGAIYDAFGQRFMEDTRSNYITQCRGDQTEASIECCRSRIVQDIEETNPLIIVTIGDAPLRWIMGSSFKGSALTHRGAVMVARVGKVNAWVVPLIFPNFAFKDKRAGSNKEYEWAFKHDAKIVMSMAGDRSLERPYIPQAPYDGGVEIITGDGVGDMGRLEDMLTIIAREPRSAIDIETNGLRPFYLKDPMLLTVAVGTFDRVVAFPLQHPDGWGTDARRARVMGLFGEYLLESGRKAAHNLAMEMEWLNYFYGPKVLRETEWDDTMAMAHTLDERPGTKALAMQTMMHFGFDLKAQSKVDAARLLEYPLKDVLRYNGMDSKWTDRLRDHLSPMVQANPKYVTEYERKVRLAPTLIITEAKGLPCSMPIAAKIHDDLNTQAAALEGKIKRTPEVKEFSTRFGPFEPTNPDHVLKLLDKVCSRPEIRVEDRRTGAVRMTTEEEVLSSIPAREVPSVPLILEHRAVSKLNSTYLTPVMTRKIVCPDGKIRSRYSSMTAVTGRLSSEDPNIQNFPKRKHKYVRSIVAVPDGTAFLACDYGQIEFRVVGMASEDDALVRACWTGYDVHKFWAERMVKLYPPIKDYIVETFNVDWDEKGLKTLRQEAKNGWVFPQLFGSSVRSCAEQLHLPESIAEELAEEFWDEFSQVKQWQEKLLKNYERNLYVETLTGRRRRGPMTKNEIINMPIQGTAADIVTTAMCEVSELGYMLGDDELVPNLNVHDDLSYLPSVETLDEKLEIIARVMCKPRFDFINVPLLVEASVGTNWADLEEVKVFRSDVLFNTPNPYAE